MTKKIYTVGGTVQAGNGIYIRRKADDELLSLCKEGIFAYILSPRQVGKSSLMVHTAQELEKINVQSVVVDLSKLGTYEKTIDQWYGDILGLISDSVGLKIDTGVWWASHAHQSETRRLLRFFKEVLLKKTDREVVIFFDEIDTTLSLDFTDDFFIALRSIYNDRAINEEYKRISFVLLGVASPSDLIKDRKRTPFNIGQRVDLNDFDFEDALPLASDLGNTQDHQRAALKNVFTWTNGHPYLTQRLCAELANSGNEPTEAFVSAVVERIFLGHGGRKDQNLQFVRDMLLERANDRNGVLRIYRSVIRGDQIEDDQRSANKSHLKLSGIVRSNQETLKSSNLLYQTVFDLDWVKEQLPRFANPQLVTAFVIVSFITFGLLGYIFYSKIWSIAFLWSVGAILMRSRWASLIQRTQLLLSKPIILIRDTEPNSVLAYPRSLFEQLALGARNSITILSQPFFKFFSTFISSQHELVFDPNHAFRLFGYVFQFIALLFLAYAQSVVISNTLLLLEIIDTMPTLFNLDIALVGGGLGSLIVSSIFVFETFFNPSELTRMSEKPPQEKRLYRMIATVVVFISIGSMIALFFERFKIVSQITLSPGLELFISWVIFGLTPISAAIASALIVPGGMRGLVVFIILIEWLVYGFLYLLSLIIAILNQVVTVTFDLVYRVVLIIVDISLWLLLTPVFIFIKPFELFKLSIEEENFPI